MQVVSLLLLLQLLLFLTCCSKVLVQLTYADPSNSNIFRNNNKNLDNHKRNKNLGSSELYGPEYNKEKTNDYFNNNNNNNDDDAFNHENDDDDDSRVNSPERSLKPRRDSECGKIPNILYEPSLNRRIKINNINLSHLVEHPPEGWQFYGTLMGEQESLVCGATIVGHNTVVTSRTCGYNITSNNGSNSLRIVMGDFRRQPEGFVGKVVWSLNDCAATTYTIRPSINGAYRSSDDFMMIKFDEQLNFRRDDRFQKVCLDGNANRMQDFDRCLAIGHNNYGSKVLEIESEEVEFVDCWLEDESQFCFKSTRNPSWSTCSNDSGGPILCYKDNRWQLIGIISTVQENCELGNLSDKDGIFNVAVNFEHIYKSEIWTNCSRALMHKQLEQVDDYY